MTNMDIRDAAKKNGVRMWEIAEALGISDGNFSRKLRHELEPEMKKKVLAAIAAVALKR